MARKAAPRSEPQATVSEDSPSAAPSPATVQGEGDPAAQLVFVGQLNHSSPESAELLRKMIEAMGLTSAQVFICDVANFRLLPPIQPRVVVTLGQPATQALLGNDAALAQLRGHFHLAGGIKLRPTFDPSFLMTHPESKREAWSDLQAVARELGLKIPSKKG